MESGLSNVLKSTKKRQLLCERELVLKRELELERLERNKLEEKHRFECEMQKRKVIASAETVKLEMDSRMQIMMNEAQKDAEIAKLRLETSRAKQDVRDHQEVARLQASIEAGLSSEQYTQITIAQSHLTAMANSNGVNYLAVPPGLLGFDYSQRAAPGTCLTKRLSDVNAA